MNHVFSVPEEGEEQSSLAEVCLLADRELLSLWEQTQMSAAISAGQGRDAYMAHVYERAVLLEMQRRQFFRPASSVFGAGHPRDSFKTSSFPRIMAIF